MSKKGFSLKLPSCCGEDLLIKLKPLECHGTTEALCMIPFNSRYYTYGRINICHSCFQSKDENDHLWENFSRELGDSSTSISKDKFKLRTYKGKEYEHEQTVECDSCKLVFHVVCVKYLDTMWPNGYFCETCFNGNNFIKAGTPLDPKYLTKTKLGSHIEARLSKFFESVQSSHLNVIIRVVSSIKKQCAVLEGMRSQFLGEMIMEFPYRAKTILAFQNLDGEPVCFFGMIAHEYGPDCPGPNRGWTYLAYVDSIPYFQPSELRSSVYHQVLLAYWDFAKSLGFSYSYFWICPPKPKSEYIFFGHPKTQKFPNFKRLLDWYLKMLNLGVTQNILTQYQNLAGFIRTGGITDPIHVPYFDGDQAPIIIERAILESERWKNIKSKKQRDSTNPDLPNIILKSLEKLKDSITVAKLHNGSNELSLQEDPDPVMNSVLMDDRSGLFKLGIRKNCDFSSLRQAQYSTLLLLSELYTENGVELPQIVPCTLQTMVSDTKPNDWTVKLMSTIPHFKTCTSCDFCTDSTKSLEHGWKCPFTEKPNCSLCTNYERLCVLHSSVCLESACPIPFCTSLRSLNASHAPNSIKEYVKVPNQICAIGVIDCNPTPSCKFESSSLQEGESSSGLLCDQGDQHELSKPPKRKRFQWNSEPDPQTNKKDLKESPVTLLDDTHRMDASNVNMEETNKYNLAFLLDIM